MSKELEIIKELRCLVYSCQDSGFITNAEKVFLPLLERLEKATNEYEKMRFVIKTIKEKGVHLSGTGEAYTQEEYDAIKEILL